MTSLKDFIPDAQFHESNGDLEKAIEVYSKGIESLPNDTSNTWRLYWSRAGLKIKMAQNVFEKAGKSTETEWELQQKLYTEAEYDLKQAIKGQESNARIWITYSKCAMALGDRAGTERGLEKAKQYGKSEFAALLHELQLWENGLAPSAKENLGVIKELAAQTMAAVEPYASKEWQKEMKRMVDGQLPSRPIKEGVSWARCKDGITRRVDKEGNLDMGEIKPILDPNGKKIGEYGGKVNLKEFNLWIPKKK